MTERFSISSQSTPLPTTGKGLLDILLSQKVNRDLISYISQAPTTPSKQSTLTNTNSSANSYQWFFNLALAKNKQAIKMLQLPLPDEIAKQVKTFAQQPLMARLASGIGSQTPILQVANEQSALYLQGSQKIPPTTISKLISLLNSWLAREPNPLKSDGLKLAQLPISQPAKGTTQNSGAQATGNQFTGAQLEKILNSNSQGKGSASRSWTTFAPSVASKVTTKETTNQVNSGNVNQDTQAKIKAPPSSTNIMLDSLIKLQGKTSAMPLGNQISMNFGSSGIFANKTISQYGNFRHFSLLPKTNFTDGVSRSIKNNLPVNNTLPNLLNNNLGKNASFTRDIVQIRPPIALTQAQSENIRAILNNDLNQQKPIADALNSLVKLAQSPASKLLSSASVEILQSFIKLSRADANSIKHLMRLSGATHERQIFEQIKPFTSPQTSGGSSSNIQNNPNNVPSIVPDLKHLFGAIRLLLSPIITSEQSSQSWLGKLISSARSISGDAKPTRAESKIKRSLLGTQQQQLLQTLKQEVEGASARVRLNQLGNILSNDPTSFIFEIPIFFRQQFSSVQLKWQVDEDHQDKLSAKHRWAVTIRFDFESTGAFQACVKMSEKHLDVRFIAERLTTQQLLTESMDELSQRLIDAGLMLPEVSTEQATCPDLVKSNAKQSVSCAI